MAVESSPQRTALDADSCMSDCGFSICSDTHLVTPGLVVNNSNTTRPTNRQTFRRGKRADAGWESPLLRKDQVAAV